METYKPIDKELYAPERRNFQRWNATTRTNKEEIKVCIDDYRLFQQTCVCIACFALSRIRLSSSDVAKALNNMLLKAHMKHLETDIGKEYYNSIVLYCEYTVE